MRTLRSPFPLTLLLGLVLTLSCKKEPEPGCGCDGATFKHFDNVDASNLGGGAFEIFEASDTVNNRTIMYACVIDSTLEKSPSRTSRDYKLTGDSKVQCSDFQYVFYQFPRIKITRISKK